jgi:hypothetical protein
MAAITVRRPRLVTAAAAMLILASASACGGHAGPAPQRPSATSTSSTPVDLSNVLIQPAGFGPVPNDTTSGPLQTPDDVRRFFTDRPSDPAEILSHGFAGGYVREWQAPQNPSPSGSTVIVAPTLLEVVLQFDTAAHAMTVEQYFRHAPQLWPVTSFAVPSQLTAGYGQYQVQGSGTTASYLYAVVWVSRNRLFNVGIDYSAPQKSPDQAISVAVTQNRAGP